MESALSKGGVAMNRKTIKISEKRQITIPQKYYEELGFTNEAECLMRGNEIVLRPVKTVSGGEFAEQILADLIAKGSSNDELLAAFGAADIDSALAARNADNLPAARTGEVAVLPVAQAGEEALERGVFPAARFDVARVRPEQRPDQRHVRQRTKCGHPRRKVAAPESAHEHQHNRKNEQPFVKGICSVASVHEPPQRIAQLLKHVTAPCISYEIIC